MSRDTLSVKRFPVSLLSIALACLLPLACTSSEDAAGPDDGQGPGDGPGGPNPTVTASVVISDVSPTAAMSGVDAITGEVSFSGLTVEISEDGENWLTVTDGPTTAAVALGDGAAEATLVPATEIPAGDYTQARITATGAEVDISAMLNGQEFSAQLRTPAGQSIQITKAIEVIDNGDGTRTFRIELTTIATFSLRSEPGAGIMIEIGGDFETISAAASMSAAVVASDVSAPAGVDVSGEVTFTNLTIELSDDDGQTWLKVAESQGTATVALGDGSVDATLVPVEEIPAGVYSRARLTATDAVVDITAVIDGQELAAQFRPPGSDPIVIEKQIEAIVHDDGTTTFRFELEMVRTIEARQGAGGMELVIDGDLGSAAAAASMRAGVNASDGSSPAGANVSGNVVFSGLTIELSADGETWLTVAENEGEATVALGDGTAEAILMPVDEIPARSSDDPYTLVRFTAANALLELTADMGGESVQVSITDMGPVVIEKDVTVVDNGDGTSIFRFELECVRTIDLRTDAASGATIVTVDGDLGVGQAPAS